MPTTSRSEEHTSELQSHSHLVCRLLLEKKKGSRKMRRSAGGHRSRQTVRLRLVRLVLEPATRIRAPLSALSDPSPSRHLFFFKGHGAPRNLPFSPPRRLPF